mgnify:CR=1 FL=1
MIKNSLIYDFFAHPMRIFFIYSGVLGILGACVLGFRIGDFIGLHQFIFLELFCASAFCGFLFTAVVDWTGFKGSLIPYSVAGFVLLNLALVDIGAGTSDIAITKEGSVVAYGMIPTAGDEVTEAIVHKYLGK